MYGTGRSLDFYEFIGGIGIMVVLMLSTAIIGSAATAHNNDDIKEAITQQLNAQPDVDDNGSPIYVQASDLVVLDTNENTMTFVKDEKVFVSDYNIKHNVFSDNDITVSSVQQIKHDVYISGNN